MARDPYDIFVDGEDFDECRITRDKMRDQLTRKQGVMKVTHENPTLRASPHRCRVSESLDVRRGQEGPVASRESGSKICSSVGRVGAHEADPERKVSHMDWVSSDRI